MANIETLKRRNGTIVYPVTRLECVKDEDGNNMADLMRAQHADLQKAIDKESERAQGAEQALQNGKQEKLESVTEYKSGSDTMATDIVVHAGAPMRRRSARMSVDADSQSAIISVEAENSAAVLLQEGRVILQGSNGVELEETTPLKMGANQLQVDGKRLIFGLDGTVRWRTVEEEGEKDYSKQYLTMRSAEDAQFSFVRRGSGADIQYSLDEGATWTALHSGEWTPLVEAGHNIMWKGELEPATGEDVSEAGVGSFKCTHDYLVEGNVMSLLWGEVFEHHNELKGGRCFAILFSSVGEYDPDAPTLVNAENLVLPSLVMTEGAYAYMFYRCKLRKAPKLPATILAGMCYMAMFYLCPLEEAPELPATTLAMGCYSNMFAVTNLTEAPTLPAKTLEPQCYAGMFHSCVNLKSARIEATNIPDSSSMEGMLIGVAPMGVLQITQSLRKKIKDNGWEATCLPSDGEKLFPGWVIEDI